MRTRKYFSAALLLILLFVLNCTKEIERIVYENNPNSPCGKIVGVVVQKESGARVYVKQEVLMDSTVIDPETGAFEIDSLTAGNYDLLVIAENYGTYRENVMVFDESVTYTGEIVLSQLPDLIHSHFPDDQAEIVVSSYSWISVIINFSDAMDRESVEQAFSTEPSTEGKLYWSQSVWEPYSYWYLYGNWDGPGLAPESEPADISTFTHVRCLQYRMESKYVETNTEYRIVLSAAAHDTAGNHLLFPLEFSFRTIESAQTQTAILTDPDDGAENVSLRNNKSIYVTFPKRMDRASVENAVTMTPEANTIFLWPKDNQLKIYTGGPLMADTTYVITIDATAHDLDGVPLEEVFRFSFTTESVRITGTYPQNGEVFIELTPKIYIHFNTYMIASTLQGAFSIRPEVGGRFEWDDYNQCVCFYPQKLQPLTKYTIQVDTSVTDYLGTPLKEPYEFSFVSRPE